MEKENFISVYVPAELKQAFKIKALQNRKTMSEVINALVKLYVKGKVKL